MNSDECHLATNISEDTPLHALTALPQDSTLNEEQSDDMLPKEYHSLIENNTNKTKVWTSQECSLKVFIWRHTCYVIKQR